MLEQALLNGLSKNLQEGTEITERNFFGPFIDSESLLSTRLLS